MKNIYDGFLELKSYWLIIFTGFVIGTSLIGCPIGRSGYETPCDKDCVKLSKIDFVPVSGGYNIEWPGPPRHKLNYNTDVKHFNVLLELDRNAPRSFSREFLIQEDRWYGWDTLGKFTATFNEGSRTPTISYASKCCGATTAPTGTPNPLIGNTFWMGCTKKGNTKANGPKGDDNEADIRLEKVNKSDSIGVRGKFSRLHLVKCLDGVGGSSSSNNGSSSSSTPHDEPKPPPGGHPY